MATYLPVARASYSQTSFTNPMPLLTDGDDAVSRSGTIASGTGVVKRGTIVKFVPATGVTTLPAAAADCNGVLAEDVDATAATVSALIIVSGKVNAAALIWPALNHGDCADALRNYSIIVESTVYTDGTLIKSAPTDAEASEAKARLDKARADLKKAEEEAAKAPGEKEEDKDKPKPSDSVFAYLTAEEREKHPELAEPPAQT